MWYRIVESTGPEVFDNGWYLKVVEVPVIKDEVPGELLQDIKRRNPAFMGVCVIDEKGGKKFIKFSDVPEFEKHVAGKPMSGISRLTSMGGG
ncbi:MAG TPA: hypothetical protein PLK76_03975 [bacterium]|nr:hypothetical protein [bacterium]